METTEIMVNEDVIETTEEIVKASSGKGFKVVTGIGLAIVVGVIAYKYIAKPMWVKFKTNKEQPAIKVVTEDVEEDGQVSDEEESEETK